MLYKLFRQGKNNFSLTSTEMAEFCRRLLDSVEFMVKNNIPTVVSSYHNSTAEIINGKDVNSVLFAKYKEGSQDIVDAIRIATSLPGSESLTLEELQSFNTEVITKWHKLPEFHYGDHNSNGTMFSNYLNRNDVTSEDKMKLLGATAAAELDSLANNIFADIVVGREPKNLKVFHNEIFLFQLLPSLFEQRLEQLDLPVACGNHYVRYTIWAASDTNLPIFMHQERGYTDLLTMQCMMGRFSPRYVEINELLEKAINDEVKRRVGNSDVVHAVLKYENGGRLDKPFDIGEFYQGVMERWQSRMIKAGMAGEYHQIEVAGAERLQTIAQQMGTKMGEVRQR